MSKRLIAGLVLLVPALLVGCVETETPTATTSPVEATVALVTPTSPPTVVPQASTLTDLPRYAVVASGDQSANAVQATAATGAKMMRFGLYWSVVEPHPQDAAIYNWAAYDDAIARFPAAGLQILAVVGNCPTWACSDYRGPFDKASSVEPFAKFMEAAVSRYSQPPYDVHYWELFNEPDDTGGRDLVVGWGKHGDQYAAMLKTVVPRIRAIDPQARIFLGGLAYEWFTDENPNPGPFVRHWLKDMVAAGGGPYFDYINFHYFPQNPHFPSVADKAVAIRKVADELGLKQPLVCTEIGLTSSNDPRWTVPNGPLNSEEVQSRFLVRAFTEGFSAGLASMAWYSLQDFKTEFIGWQIFAEAGLVRDDWRPKPAVDAYKVLIGKLGSRPFLRRLDATAIGDGVLDGYAFGEGVEEVWVVWSKTLDVRPLSPVPPGGRSIVGATDMYGTAIAFSGMMLAVGPNPVYLTLR